MTCQVCEAGEAVDESIYMPAEVATILALMDYHRGRAGADAEAFDSWPSARLCPACTDLVERIPAQPDPAVDEALAMTTDLYVAWLREQVQRVRAG